MIAYISAFASLPGALQNPFSVLDKVEAIPSTKTEMEIRAPTTRRRKIVMETCREETTEFEKTLIKTFIEWLRKRAKDPLLTSLTEEDFDDEMDGNEEVRRQKRKVYLIVSCQQKV